MRIGVLALQGDVREHARAVEKAGAEAATVKHASDLVGLSGLILPGGESTTIAKLARSFGLFDPIKSAIASGLPTYGSCAGMILLADELVNGQPGQETFGGMHLSVRRNAFGRQVDSHEVDLEVRGIGVMRAIFIRAPWVESTSAEVEILAEATISGHTHPVAVRQGNLLATSFHPELTGDERIHRYFVQEICRQANFDFAGETGTTGDGGVDTHVRPL